MIEDIEYHRESEVYVHAKCHGLTSEMIVSPTVAGRPASTIRIPSGDGSSRAVLRSRLQRRVELARLGGVYEALPGLGSAGDLDARRVHRIADKPARLDGGDLHAGSVADTAPCLPPVKAKRNVIRHGHIVTY